MNWINAFELLCYAITAVFLWDVIRKKNREELCLFLSAMIAGFALELLAVRVTDIYHYSPDFYISIGFKPYQFPFFGGLMWDGREISLDITHHMFMSVIWVNFLGYMFETPAMVFISLKTAEKRSGLPCWKQVLAAIGIGACGVAFVGAASGISLLLNAVTDEWFACIAFLLLWCFVLVMIIRQCTGIGIRISPANNWDKSVLIYWMVMYGFSLAALIHLGIASAVPAYFIFGLLVFMGTIVLAVRE